MSKRNTIDYVCYNEKCKHNDNGFCQLKGVKPNGCINAISKQGYELGIEWRDKQISDLEAKLAEKQSRIQELNDMYEDLLVAKGTENELMQTRADCDFFAKENRKLKQQLAEKEKEIERLSIAKELLLSDLHYARMECEKTNRQIIEFDKSCGDIINNLITQIEQTNKIKRLKKDK